MARSDKPSGQEYIALPSGTLRDAELLEDELNDEETAFNEFRTGFGAEKMGELRVGKLKLGRDGAPIANSKSVHCFSCAVDRYNFSELLEYIREHYGSGVFRIVGIESGRKGVVFNKLVEIAEDKGPKTGPQESPLQNPQNLFESVGRIMAESQARTEALIARTLETRTIPTAPVDPMDTMAKMATLMATLMGVMPKPAADDLLGSLEKLAKVKELLGTFSGDGGNGGGAEANFYDVVKTGLQSFGPALATLAMRNTQIAPQTPALAPPAPVAPPNTAANYDKPNGRQPGQEQGNIAMESLKRQIGALIMNAKLGATPDQVANMVLDSTPDDKLDALANMIEDPACVDKMAQLNPDVQNYRDFFNQLRAALMALLTEDEPATLAAGAAADHSASPPGDASTA